jgi:hypothetical protein
MYPRDGEKRKGGKEERGEKERRRRSRERERESWHRSCSGELEIESMSGGGRAWMGGREGTIAGSIDGECRLDGAGLDRAVRRESGGGRRRERSGGRVKSERS